MFSITTAEFFRIKRMYENSEYYIVLDQIESINNKMIDQFSIHEQIMLNFYLIQSLIKTGSFKKISEKLISIQERYSSVKLDLIDNLIYFIVLIISFESTGKIDDELIWYQKGKELIKNNLEILIHSEENYWYYYFILVSAIIETNQRNYTIAYDKLKQLNNYFLKTDTKSHSDKLMLASINTQLGKIHRLTNYLDIASNNFKKAIDWSKEAHNLEYTRGNYLNLSLVYEDQGKEYLALQICHELIQEIDTNFDHDEFSISSAYNLLGNIYNRTGEFVLAREMYLKALDIISDSSVLERVKSFNLNNIGVISFKLGNFNESLNYFIQALELALHKQDPRELASYYSNIGEAYLELGILDEAYENELSALKYLKLIQNDSLLVETYFIIVRICLEREDFEKADFYIHEMSLISLKARKSKFDYKIKICKALKLKKEKKLFEAKEIFLTILKNQNLALDLQTIALVELAGLVFDSLIVNDTTCIDQSEIIKKLNLLGKQSKSIPVICNLTILQSRLKMLALDFESAENLLTEADDYCISKNVSYFRTKIQDELQFIHDVRQQANINSEQVRNLLKEKLRSNNSFKGIRDLERLIFS